MSRSPSSTIIERGARVEEVADEHRAAVAPERVRRRAAAAELGEVDDVVVEQRRRVQQLDGGGRPASDAVRCSRRARPRAAAAPGACACRPSRARDRRAAREHLARRSELLAHRALDLREGVGESARSPRRRRRARRGVGESSVIAANASPTVPRGCQSEKLEKISNVAMVNDRYAALVNGRGRAATRRRRRRRRPARAARRAAPAARRARPPGPARGGSRAARPRASAQRRAAPRGGSRRRARPRRRRRRRRAARDRAGSTRARARARDRRRARATRTPPAAFT